MQKVLWPYTSRGVTSNKLKLNYMQKVVQTLSVDHIGIDTFLTHDVIIL